jgi:hypothetical protein
MKAKKLIAGIAAIAVVGTCGVALAGCGESSSSSVKTYTLKIENWADWTDANEHPMSLGQSGALWGLDTWLASGTKVKTDDDGNMVGVYYQFTLDIDEDCQLPDYVNYTLSYSVHADPSEIYKEPVDACYSFTGYAWAIPGGYHLMAPQFAEATIIGEAFKETMSQGISPLAEYSGPNGGTLYYFYCNSDLFSAGVEFGFPFITNPLQGMFACDVEVADSAISSFKVTGEQAPELTVPETTDSGLGGFGSNEGQDNQDSSESNYITSDETMSAAATAGNKTGAYTYSYSEKDDFGSTNEYTVTVTLKADGTLTFVRERTSEGFGPTTLHYNGTYKVYENGGKTYLIITGLGLDEADNGQGGNATGAVPTAEWLANGNTIVVLGADNSFTPYTK